MVYSDIFASEIAGDAFASGAGFAVAILILGAAFASVLDVVWDLIRRKKGLPVSRYVRWVKEQTEVNEK